MRDNNTLKACFYHIDENGVKTPKGKEYSWHIPKKLRVKNIQKGDLVLIKGLNGRKKKMIVTEVFREDVEDTGKYYKSIMDKIFDNKPDSKPKAKIDKTKIEAAT